MIFGGREIPEEEFKALTRRIFAKELADLQQMAVDTKALKWFQRTPQTDEESFAAWLKTLGVKPFPLYPGLKK